MRADRAGCERSGTHSVTLGAGETELFDGAACGSGLRGAVLVLSEPGHSVGQGRKLGEQGEQLLVLVAADESGGGQQHRRRCRAGVAIRGGRT